MINKKSIICILLAMSLSTSLIAFAETPLEVQQREYQKKLEELQKNVQDMPKFELPRIEPKDMPKNAGKTAEELYKELYGDAGKSKPTMESNMPSDAFFQSKVDAIKQEGNIVDIKRAESSAKINDMIAKPVSPYGLDLNAKLSEFKARTKAISDIAQKEATSPAGFGSVKIDRSKFGTVKEISPELKQEIENMIGDVKEKTKQTQTDTTQSSTGVTTQGVNSTLGSFINPSGSYIADTIANKDRIDELSVKENAGTITTTESVELNKLESYGIKSTLKDFGDFLFDGKVGN